MKLGLTAKALALALVVGVSSQAMAATTTNTWWDIDFESVSTITALTNESFSTVGQWTTGTEDGSTITNTTGDLTRLNFLKLDTQGSDLAWTPTVASTSKVVLVNADIFLVGSDSAPTGFDEDKINNPVQAAVYLKNYIDDIDNATTSSVLCAYVADGEQNNKWVELSGVTMTDTNWYGIKIEIDYAETYPVARFYVGTTQMVGSLNEESFQIANYVKFDTPATMKVKSILFRGTGAVDNFVAKQVVPEAAAQLTFTLTSYTDNVEDGLFNGAASPSSTVNVGQEIQIAFNPADLTFTKFLKVVRVYTNETNYVDYTAQLDEETGFGPVDAPLIQSAEGMVLLSISTTDLTAGYTIKAYYGAEPTGGDDPVVPTSPAIGGGDIGTTDPVAFELIPVGEPAVDTEFFCVSFAATQAGVTYSLQTTAALSTAFADELGERATVNSTAVGQVITLRAPTGGAATKFFRVKAVATP